jgi:GDSL-like Lipase/Acylhydrolase family
MQSIDLQNLDALLDGHVDIRRRPGSVQPIRYPVAEAGFYDPFTRWVASAPAGVRLRLRTDSRSLRLTGSQRLAATGPEGAARPAAYDLFVDDTLFARRAATGGAVMALDGSLTGDEHAEVRFEGLPAGDKTLALWLPQGATLAITALELDDGAAWAAWPDARRRIVFHGSSISHCMEADGGSGSWPAVACALASARLLNLGWGGSCLISGLAARIIREQSADAIVLKLGINVWADGMLKERTFADSVHSMISIIREKHVRTPIAVISPIFSPGREDAGDNGGLTLERMRDLLQEAVAARLRAGDGAIRYLSGLDLFGETDAPDLPDNLHPNAAGYQRMGERFHRLALSGEGALISS